MTPVGVRRRATAHLRRAARSGPADALPAAPQPLRVPGEGAGRLRREGTDLDADDARRRRRRPTRRCAPDYMVDDVVKASETGALGAGTSSPKCAPTSRRSSDRRREGRAPSRSASRSPRRDVNDDGVPKRRRRRSARRRRSVSAASAPGAVRAGPAARAAAASPSVVPPTRITVGKNVGLHLSWFVYRGARTREHLDPAAGQAVGRHARRCELAVGAALDAAADARTMARYPARSTFSAPGTYVLRCRADDGALAGATTK